MDLSGIEHAVEEAVEEVVGGILGGHELKPVASPGEVAAVKSGESIISRALLHEISLRRAVADLDTLIAACGKLLDLLEGKSEEPAPEPAPEPEPAVEPEVEQTNGDSQPENSADPAQEA